VDTAQFDALLSRIRRLESEGGILVYGAGFEDLYELSLFAPATEDQIRMAERVVGKELPADFLQFWRFSDGANLFVNESALHGIGVASTDLIGELQQEEAEYYSYQALAPYIVFARVNGAGDFLVFEAATGKVLDGVHAEEPHEWRVVADSFSDWLARLVDAGGGYYWIESLYEAASAELA